MGMTFSMCPAALTLTQRRQENGPLKESAYHGVFFGFGGASTCSTSTVPSVGAGAFRLSYHVESCAHSNGVGIGVEGVTGVSVICSSLGGRTSMASSTRTLAQVSAGWPPMRAGSKTHRSNDFLVSDMNEGIGTSTRLDWVTRPARSTRIAPKNGAVTVNSVKTGLGVGSFFFNDAAPTEIYTLSLHDAK